VFGLTMQLREEAATETQVLVVENDSNFGWGLPQ
jgi:hypothetical protein